MPKIKVTVQLLPEGPSDFPEAAWELDEPTVMRLMQFLMQAPRRPVDAGPPRRAKGASATGERITSNMTIAQGIIWAYERMGKTYISIGGVTDYMLESGWQTKSKRPSAVVGTALRELGDRGIFEKSDRGWKQLVDDSATATKPKERAFHEPIGPGLKELVAHRVRSRGIATLDDVVSDIEKQYPGQAHRSSIRSTARLLVNDGVLRRTEDKRFIAG